MLHKEQVLEAFERLAARLADAGVIGELQLLGGAVMILAFQARQATKDVDAIFAPAAEVRAAARQVAAEMDLEPDWLNDAAKGFASPAGDFSDRVLPQYSNLRLLTPSIEYMLAMKIMAARLPAAREQGDSVMNSLKRPHSLAQAAAWTESYHDFGTQVADFLHYFKTHSEFDALQDEPRPLAGLFTGGDIADCYLAALAVELATQINHARPAWAQHPARFRREPWFASPGPHMRALLIVESPPGFRERNLFVTANALSVA